MKLFEKLFTYYTLYEACEESYGFGEVVMLRNFGPLKIGDKLDNIWFHPTDSMCRVYDDNNELVHEFEFDLCVS